MASSSNGVAGARLGTNSTGDAGEELGSQTEDTAARQAALEPAAGHPQWGAAFRETMPRADKGFSPQSCLNRTQNPKQEQHNSLDTKHKSSDLKTNPASLPTTVSLQSCPSFSLCFQHTCCDSLAHVSLGPSRPCLPEAIPFPFSHCQLCPELMPCACACSWSLSCTTAAVPAPRPALLPSQEVPLARPWTPIKQPSHYKCLSLENSKGKSKSTSHAVKGQCSDKKPTSPLLFL